MKKMMLLIVVLLSSSMSLAYDIADYGDSRTQVKTCAFDDFRTLYDQLSSAEVEVITGEELVGTVKSIMMQEIGSDCYVVIPDFRNMVSIPGSKTVTYVVSDATRGYEVVYVTDMESDTERVSVKALH